LLICLFSTQIFSYVDLISYMCIEVQCAIVAEK